MASIPKIPLRRDGKMHIVIIGASAAGLSALEKLRKLDADCRITVISQDAARPYSRVLIPYYLSGKTGWDNLFIRDPNYFESLNCSHISGTVSGLEPQTKTLTLKGGQTVQYDRLLITTGSSPAKPPIAGIDGDNIHHMWTLKDIELLAPLYESARKMVVLGSGFVSLQAAWAGVQRGLEVTVIEILPRIMPLVLDHKASELLGARMKAKGVTLHLEAASRAIEHTANGSLLVHRASHKPIEADFMVVGTGVRPNVDFLTGSGIEMGRGILVNRRMETSLPDVYAAGDVAQGPTIFGPERTIHALWPTAVEMGAVAGENLAGKKNGYQGSLNMNVTQMFDLTVASMGKFQDGDGDEVWIDQALPQGSYLKIVLQDHTPIGGVAAGGSELVATLGILRPLIREKVRLRPGRCNLQSMWAQALARHHEAFAKTAG